jgi:hypothetical protein
MAHVIQVEIRTGTTHTVTWLDGALKPKPGMALVCKGDPRPWTVVHAYGIAAREVQDINVSWKVASSKAPIYVA